MNRCCLPIIQMFLAGVLLNVTITLPIMVVQGASSDEISMGTTIVALKTKTGVVLGADTRTSAGSMVSNRYAHKLTWILKDEPPVQQDDDDGTTKPTQCVLCRSGSAADTQFLADQARWAFWKRPDACSVAQIARWLRYVVMNGNYGASLICAGRDSVPVDGGGKIYTISKSGALLEEAQYAVAGSGSTYIVGLMDTKLHSLAKNGETLMEEAEAIDFVATLIHAAIARDGGSGGMARLVIMNQEGSREIIVAPPSLNLGEGPPQQQSSTSKKELPGFENAKPSTKSAFLTATATSSPPFVSSSRQ